MSEILFLPLKIVLIALDLFLTLITFGWIGAIQKLLEGPPVRSVPVADDESHRVATDYKGNLLTTPREGVKTLYDLAKDSFGRYATRNCLGTRQFLGWKSKKPAIKEFGETKWRTFAEAGREAHQFGAALRAAGVVPAPNTTTLDKVKTPCRIAIFENTCAEWMIAAMGAFTQSITVTTVYATLGMDAVVEAVADNIIPCIVCNKKDVARLCEKAKQMPTLTHIIYTEDLCGRDEADMKFPPQPKGVTIVSLTDFIASGNVTAYPPTPPEADTCAVVMYTSGSTGKPKGVVITQAQILAVIASGEVAFEVQEGKDVYLGYLPLAHIMELMAEFMMIARGCTICYADPKSLTAAGASPHGALEEFSPTLMVAVPKIWDIIKKGISSKVSAGSPVVQFLFNTALEWKTFCLQNGFDTPLFNVLVFKKLKAAVGGKLRYALSGGGPLNASVQDFLRAAFGINFVQGYGLTETCAGLTIQAPDDFRGGVAGVPIPSVEIKLVSTPDVGDKAGQPYLSTDRSDVEGNPVWGRGEIVGRGGNISCGYYMMPDKTKEEYKDGWFHTGDIGEFLPDGSLKIVDRKKNLLKLKGGEYIALERMEMTYGNSNWVDAAAGGICCYGDGDMDRPVALLQLNKTTTMKWAKANGHEEDDFEKLKNSKEVYDAVMADMKAQHASSDLSHLEKLVAVSLLTSPWTPENGCLTAANKLQRREVVRQFDKDFQEVKKKGVF